MRRQGWQTAASVLALAAATALAPSTLLGQTRTTVTITTDSWDARTTNLIIPQCAGARAMIVRPGPNVQRVEVAEVGATIDLADGVATTTLRMTLKNPGSHQQEAQLLVPVPDGCAVRTFGFDGKGQEPTAKLLPRDEARRIYEDIVRRVQDPALLEFVGFNLVKSSVFPVPAGGTQVVTLTYEQVITRDSSGAGERVDYFLPRSASLESSGTKWTISGKVRSKLPISTVYSPSHMLASKRVSDTEWAFEVPERSAAEPGAFRISTLLTRPDVKGIAASVFAYPDGQSAGGDGYFLLLAGLPSGQDDAAAIKRRREVVIVIDRSGSMRGEKIEQARGAALQVVEGLNEGEAFNIIDYSDSIARFSESPVVKTAKTLADAKAYISGLQAEGGTNIHGALQEAMRQPVTPECLPMVLFLTDGLATAGNTSEIAIREDTAKANTAKRRIFTFGVGVDLNAPLLDRVAEVTRGASINVLPGENIEVAVSRVFKRLQGPIMSEPRLIAVGPDGSSSVRALRDILPINLPDLFEGDQLVILGRYIEAAAREGTTLRIEGDCNGKRKSYDVALDVKAATQSNGHVPRLWATRKIAYLIDEIRQAGATAQPGGVTGDPRTDPRTKELVEEIVALSTRWGILTEYTSFLATEAGVETAARTQTEVLALATDELQKKAVSLRAGAEGVNQSRNIKDQAMAACATPSNGFWAADFSRQVVGGVQQCGDQTLFSRGKRWVDSRILDKPEFEKPDRTIAFASKEHFDLATRLASLDGGGRSSLLAMQGEVYLLVDGQRVLIEAAAPQTP